MSIGQFLAFLALKALISDGSGQVWVNPGGVGGPPPDRVTYSTNRLDLDVNGTTDFEIVNRGMTTYVSDFSGWVGRTTTTITLVPSGGAQILASDLNDLFAGDVPILGENDIVGPAKPGWRWSATAHTLVTRSEPSFLSGPLARVWNGTPGKYYVGVSLGTPELPAYGWLCFSRDRGINPLYWGFAKVVSTLVRAGDLSTAPTLKMKVELMDIALPGWKWSSISWEPGFAEVAVEERVGLTGSWNLVTDPSNPGFRIPNYRAQVTDDTPKGELRLYRIRFGP